MGASERDEFLRAAWRTLIVGKIDAESLVFVDEMGSNTALAPLQTWAPRGERARCSVARNREEHNAPGEHDEQRDGAVRGAGGNHDRRGLRGLRRAGPRPALRPGQVVVLDNLGAHKGERVQKLIEERGCELLFLPPYSPDLNPIEEAFSKVKGLLRRARARSREALIEMMGRALDTVATKGTRGFFKHCGYPLPVQPL